MKLILSAAIAFLFVGLTSASAQQPTTPPDVDIGPAVGSLGPPLAVQDISGTPRTLKSIAGPKGVVLVFFRSARWCPFCQAQLISLRDLADPLKARGYTLAAVSYDAPDALATFAKQRDVTYALLSDPGSKTIDAWRLRDPQYPEHSFAYGVPKPAIFVMTAKGVVKAKLAKEGYKVRPDNAAILAAVDR